MIRLNLIEAANRSTSSGPAIVRPVHLNKGAGAAKNGKNIKTLLAAAAFVVVAACCYVVVFGLPSAITGVVPESALDAVGVSTKSKEPAAGSLAAKRAAMAEAKAKANRTIPMIVSEVKPTMFEVKKERSLYKDFYPLEKMQYQKAALGQFFAFLQTATPENTGFTNIVFEAPNYYYVRGVAEAPVSQRAFLERLRAISTDFKTPPTSKEQENVTEITAFGSVHTAAIQFKDNMKEFVAADSVAAEIRKLKSLEGAVKLSFNGIDKPKIEDFGVYKHYTFNIRTLTNFVQFANFVSSWKDSDARFGITRVAMERSGKDVAVSFVLDMYVTP